MNIVTKNNVIIIATLVVFTLFVRLSTLMPIHTGVDERDYWHSAKALSQGLPYPELTHRTVRFSVILPTAFIQLFSGVGPNVYYVLPILNSMVQAALFFVIGCRLKNQFTGLVGAFGIISFPYMIRAGSQVRPEIFSITYIALVLFFLLLYIDGEDDRYLWLVLSGFLIFISYEAKITNLFFLPGIFISVWHAKKKIFPIVVLGIVPFFLFIVETVLYIVFTDFPFGQLQVIASNHLEGNASLKQMGLFDLFLRYSPVYLEKYWRYPFILFAILAIRSFFVKSERKILFVLIYPAISFFFFLTFAVKSINPIVPAEPFINRYFSAVLVPVILVIAFSFSNFLDYLSKKINRFPSFENITAYMVVGLLTFCSFSLFLFSAVTPIPSSWRTFLPNPLHLNKHPLGVNLSLERLINHAWDKGFPIVAVRESTGRNIAGMNALLTCSYYFIDYKNYPQGIPPKPVPSEINEASVFVLRKEKNIKKEFQTHVLAAVRNPFNVAEIEIDRLPYLTENKLP